MSYDLSFVPEEGEQLSQLNFETFFDGRPNYRLQGNRAYYENEDTGVYFDFSFYETEIAFNVNYFRPHVFALEAALELEDFNEIFRLPVEDPQGFMEGRYSRDAFLEGWRSGNEGAFQVILSRHPGSYYTLPGEQIEAFWRWNYHRGALQNRIGDRIFVPVVLFVDYDGEVASVAVWTDGIATALPIVDYLFIVRYHLSPSPRMIGEEEPDLALAAWEDLKPALMDFAYRSDPADHILLDYEETPGTLSELIRSLPAFDVQLSRIPLEKILEEELVAKHLK